MREVSNLNAYCVQAIIEANILLVASDAALFWVVVTEQNCRASMVFFYIVSSDNISLSESIPLIKNKLIRPFILNRYGLAKNLVCIFS